MEAKIKLSPPWMTFYREMEALFGGDPEIEVKYDEGVDAVKLYVDNTEKAEALSKILPRKKEFGNVTVAIEVIPSNETEMDVAGLFRQAFDGNPALSYIATIRGPFANPLDYVVFQNKVVQFFNDDIGDINGLKSTLYQEIARDVFEGVSGIFFCTDTEENPGKPLEELS